MARLLALQNYYKSSSAERARIPLVEGYNGGSVGGRMRRIHLEFGLLKNAECFVGSDGRIDCKAQRGALKEEASTNSMLSS